jgi:hypothetical protein
MRRVKERVRRFSPVLFFQEPGRLALFISSQKKWGWENVHSATYTWKLYPFILLSNLRVVMIISEFEGAEFRTK